MLGLGAEMLEGGGAADGWFALSTSASLGKAVVAAAAAAGLPQAGLDIFSDLAG